MAPDQLVMTLSRRRRTRCWREEHESWDVFPPIRSVSPCVRAGLCVETIKPQSGVLSATHGRLPTCWVARAISTVTEISHDVLSCFHFFHQSAPATRHVARSTHLVRRASWYVLDGFRGSSWVSGAKGMAHLCTEDGFIKTKARFLSDSSLLLRLRDGIHCPFAMFPLRVCRVSITGF